MPSTEKQIEEIKEEITGKLVILQEHNDKIEAEGKNRDETLVAIQGGMSESIDKLEGLKAELEAETKAREELEIAVARKGDGAAGEEIKGNPEYRTAFWNNLLHKTGIDRELADDEADRMAKSLHINDEEKMHLIGSNPDGGYFAPVDFRSTILERAFEQTKIRQLASITTTGSDAVEYPFDDDLEMRALRRNELQAVIETGTGQLGTLKIEVSELYSFPKVTEKMIEDSIINTEQYVQNKIARDFSRTESYESMLGTDPLQFKGILTYDAWGAAGIYERNALETPQTAASNALAGDDLIGLQGTLLEDFQSNAVFMMHRLFWANEVTTLKDDNDNYLLNPQMLFSGAEFKLLGHPVTFSPDMTQNTSTDNAKAVVYGDFRAGYLIVDRLGITFVRDEITQPGFVKIRARKRSGAAVQNFQALKILKIKAAA